MIGNIPNIFRQTHVWILYKLIQIIHGPYIYIYIYTAVGPEKLQEQALLAPPEAPFASFLLCVFVVFCVVNIPLFIHPRCSMYGIFTYIWVIIRAIVGKYSIYGAYGHCLSIFAAINSDILKWDVSLQYHLRQSKWWFTLLHHILELVILMC